MRIKSKKTELEFTVTEEDWNAITERGDARKYIVLSKATKTAPPVNEDVADVKQIMRSASTAMKEERYEDAKSLYLEAKEIKETPLVLKKLAELDKLMSV